MNKMEEGVKNRKRQNFVLVLLFLLGVAFLIPGIIYYRKAFPEASIHFKISKTEALSRAKKYLEERGIDPSSYVETIRFDYDATAKTYLDREVGIEKMNMLFSNEVHLWRWKIRWFKPHEQKEYQVYLSPEGNIVGYHRVLPEEEEKESIPQEQALRMAEAFLSQEVGVPLRQYSLIEKDFTILNSRTDFHFTWQKNNFQAAEGEYRIALTVQGDEIGSYQGFVKVPEEWRRDYSRMRSRNQLFQKTTYFLTLPLLIMVPITLLLRMRRRDICWKVSLALALCIFVSHVLLRGNSIPLYLSQFDTTQSTGSFVGHLLISILIQALLFAVIIFLLVGASEPLYREQNPMRLSLSKFSTFRFFKTEEFFSSTVAGYSLAFFHIGYVVLFYYFGRKMGIWSPIEVGYTDALSTFLPWIYPLTISLTASLTEELLFRVFAISLLRKFLPTWLAVVIPAFLWGFLHSQYPQQPFFIRGVEVGILGIIAGYIFLRWGILATLIWHYTVDAVFIGLFLFSSSNLYFIISGAAVMGLLLIPMILALLGIAKDRHFEKSSGLLNRDETEAMSLKKGDAEAFIPPTTLEPHAPEFTPLSRNKLMVLILVTILSMLLIIMVQSPKPWPPIQLHINATRAQSLATDHLNKQGISADRFFYVVTFSNKTGSYDDRYIQNVSGWKGLRGAYQLFKETGRWITRFFIPMNEEEYIVSMDEAGQDILQTHIFPEKVKAPVLTKEKAKEQAEHYLMQERKIPLEEYVLVDSYEDQKPARTDYHFVWKWEKAKAGDGEYRISVSIVGNDISHYSKFIKVPEKWTRKDREEGFIHVVFSFLKILLLSVGGGLAIVLFVRDFMNRSIEWIRVVLAPSMAVICYLLLEMNQVPTFLSDYRTSLSLSNFLLSEILSRLFHAAGLFLFLLILSTATLSLYREIYGKASLWPEKKPSQRRAFYSSLIIALSSFFIIMAFSRVFEWINNKMDIPRAHIAPEPLPGIETFLPFIEIGFGSLLFSLITTLVIFFGLFLYKRYLRKISYLYYVALPGIAIFFGESVKSAGEFTLLFLTSLIAFTLAFFFLKRFIKENILACFLALFCMKAVPEILILLNQPLMFYQLHGLLALLLIFLPLLWIVITLYKGTKSIDHF